MITLQKKQSTIRPALFLLLLLITGILAACGGKAPQISVDPALQDLGTQPQQPIDLVF